MRNRVIWSEEHQAWWRPGSYGYTDRLKLAGRYTEQEALDIVNSANMGGEHFNEVAFPLPEGFDLLAGKETRR